MIALARDADRDWMAQAACRGHDAELWFPVTTPSQLAVRICDGCPVKQRCADYAIAHYERHGIWGGMNAEQRARARQRVTP